VVGFNYNLYIYLEKGLTYIHRYVLSTCYQIHRGKHETISLLLVLSLSPGNVSNAIESHIEHYYALKLIFLLIIMASHSFVSNDVYDVPEKPYQPCYLSFPACWFGKASPGLSARLV